LQEQLDALKTGILQFETANSELREARQSNESLVGQLDTEKAKCKSLEKRIEELCRSESDLRESSIQLDLELKELRERVTKHGSEELSKQELERQMDGLRRKLGEAEKNLKDAKSKVEKTEKLREDEHIKAVNWKVRHSCASRDHPLNITGIGRGSCRIHEEAEGKGDELHAACALLCNPC
jgi:predicted RNase H-like nuclease (RuvC/YqgF family)